MKILKLLFATLLINKCIIAQPRNEIYRFSTDIEHKIDSDTVPWKYQIGATEYTFSGFYHKALETWDRNGAGITKISKDDSSYISSFRSVNAKEYIITRSKNEQIIIINESHINPRHRTFTRSLLKGLYDNGYRYLGLEALGDTIINHRKFPSIESGYYTKEPEFGNLIHEALSIGFTLFGYDDAGNGKEREIAQAKNIFKFMSQYPNSKILIHCGHDHVIEGTPNIKSWEKAMAGRLREYTGINPFTIEQTQFSEKGNIKYNHPYIGMINNKSPVILLDKEGNLFNGYTDNSQVDSKIIHPETKYINERPDWLRTDRKPYQIKKSKLTEYPLLILAYRNSEMNANGVPADVIEITSATSTPYLILKKGEYEIVIKDKKYSIIDKFDIKMD